MGSTWRNYNDGWRLGFGKRALGLPETVAVREFSGNMKDKLPEVC